MADDENGQVVGGDDEYNLEDWLQSPYLDGSEQNLAQQLELPAGRQAAFEPQPWLPQHFVEPAGRNEDLPSLSTNQCWQPVAGTQPWSQQELSHPVGTNSWTNQGQGNQTVAAAPLLIPDQCLGQSPAIFPAVPHSQTTIGESSLPSKVLRRREQSRKNNRNYRERQGKEKQRLANENGGLRCEIQEVKQTLADEIAEKKQLYEELERLADENGRLKREIQAKEQPMKNMETEVETKRLRDEVDSLKRDNVRVIQRMETHSSELAQLRNKLDKFELKQQTERKEKRRISSTGESVGKKKRRISSTGESVAQIQENGVMPQTFQFPEMFTADSVGTVRTIGINLGRRMETDRALRQAAMAHIREKREARALKAERVRLPKEIAKA